MAWRDITETPGHRNLRNPAPVVSFGKDNRLSLNAAARQALGMTDDRNRVRLLDDPERPRMFAIRLAKPGEAGFAAGKGQNFSARTVGGNVKPGTHVILHRQGDMLVGEKPVDEDTGIDSIAIAG